MRSDTILEDRSGALAAVRRLLVAWQDPATRTITPVGRLTAESNGTYEFQYLPSAPKVIARPLGAFPDFGGRYRSMGLHPFFQNRVIPAGRSDYEQWREGLNLPEEATPFEVLAASGGHRATDTLEVFPEPLVDRSSATARCRFWVRGVRHLLGAHDEIDILAPGDRLRIVPEPENSHDPKALLLVPDSSVPVGWVPAYLCSVLHRSAETSPHHWDDLHAVVDRIGDREGPAHTRLLCELKFPWPFDLEPFDYET